MSAADASFPDIYSHDRQNSSMKKAALQTLQMVQAAVVFLWEY
jgi:hypothetical protein